MSEAATRLRKAAIERVLGGPAVTAGAARHAAFHARDVAAPATALIDKVTHAAWTVTDEDVAAVKAGGLSEDAIFELVVSAAMGQATRQLDAALAALDEAEAP